MTKNEKIFIEYIEAIRDLAMDIGMVFEDFNPNIIKQMQKELIELKKEFFEWFKKVNKNK